jgi:hypothetical protein
MDTISKIASKYNHIIRDSPNGKIMVTTAALVALHLTQTNILVVEAMLNHSLQNKVKSSGKDVVRSVMADLAAQKNGMQESEVQPVLLNAAKDLLG